MKVISASGRPHFWGDEGKDCWCSPEIEENETTIRIGHCCIDVLPDEQPRMAQFGDQRATHPELKVGIVIDWDPRRAF